MSMFEKHCPSCGRTLPLERFSWVRSRNVRQWQCLECQASDSRAWYAANRERAKARVKASQPRFKEQNRVKQYVLKAIRDGRLVRPTVCEQCGREGIRIEAAHADYARRLEVRWLCQSCHRQWDRQQPKTPAPDKSPTAGVAVE